MISRKEDAVRCSHQRAAFLFAPDLKRGYHGVKVLFVK